MHSPSSNKSILDGQNGLIDSISSHFDSNTPRDTNRFKMDMTTSSDSIKLDGKFKTRFFNLNYILCPF